MLSNIPAEITQYNQWVVWRYEDRGGPKPTKVPYDPKTGSLASVDDPSTWASFPQACAAAQAGGFDGIGFVFSDYDPFTFIDLDDTLGDKAAYERQQLIYKSFNSYSEVSPSGNGCHIIIRGRVEGAGRRRSFVEVYSRARYATFTGHVINASPVQERQDLLDILYAEMGKSEGRITHDGNSPETMADAAIIERASQAVNGDKFYALYIGNWNQYYQSQSEGDFALIDMLAFYTQNAEQIKRIFWTSQLGQRKKALRRDYVERMIQRSFDRMLPPLDLEGFGNATRQWLEDQKREAPAPGANPVQGLLGAAVANGDNRTVAQAPVAVNPYTLPPGLMGEIAQFIYDQAARPVETYALAGAIAFMAGLCGRAFNTPTQTGLNSYIVVLGETGTGKESIKAGIDKVVSSLVSTFPSILTIKGPGDIPSGQGLMRFLGRTDRKPSCISIFGEMADTFERWCDPNSSSAEKLIKKVLLDVYQKSGYGSWSDEVPYSQNDKTVPAVKSPAYSFLGESVPGKFYNLLTEDLIADGFLTRVSVMEYKGARPAYNDRVGTVEVPKLLVDKLTSLVTSVFTLNQSDSVHIVRHTPQAQQILDSFNRYADSRLDSTDNPFLVQLWNRAHLKALKLASLVAVGINWYDPLVDDNCANWAINIVVHETEQFIAKFQSGDVGEVVSDSRQLSDMKKTIKRFLDPKNRPAYIERGELWDKGIIPHSDLHKALSQYASFRKARQGSTKAIKDSINEIINHGIIRRIGPADRLRDNSLPHSGELYAIVDVRAL